MLKVNLLRFYLICFSSSSICCCSILLSSVKSATVRCLMAEGWFTFSYVIPLTSAIIPLAGSLLQQVVIEFYDGRWRRGTLIGLHRRFHSGVTRDRYLSPEDNYKRCINPRPRPINRSNCRTDAPMSLITLSPKARHLTDGRPLSRLGKVHASMTLLSLLHRLACMASEISLMEQDTYSGLSRSSWWPSAIIFAYFSCFLWYITWK